MAFSAFGNISAALINLGLGLAEGEGLVSSPWRIMFVIGALPALLAVFIRRRLKEPERWQKLGEGIRTHAKISELFSPKYRALTISGLCMAMTALVTWWSCNAFIAVVAKGLAAAGVGSLPRVPHAQVPDRGAGRVREAPLRSRSARVESRNTDAGVPSTRRRGPAWKAKDR